MNPTQAAQAPALQTAYAGGQAAQPATTQVPATPVQPPPKKRKIPIKIILIIFGILALAAVIFAGFNFVIDNKGSGGGEITLTWWGNWEDSSVIEPIIASYQEDNPNITINYVRQSKEEYRERLTNSLAQRKGPDIFRIHNTWVPMFGNSLSVLPPEIMSSEEYESTFYRAILESVSARDGIVGIPLQFDALALFINQDLFTTFGVPTPESWDELREAAGRLTISDRRSGVTTQAGIALGSVVNIKHWEEIIALMMIQNKANLTEPSDEGAIGALKYYSRFKTEDFVWDETLPDSVTAFATGKVAMIFAPTYRAYEIRRLNPAIKFKVVAVPQLPKFDESEPDITYASFYVESVWEKSKNPTAAWKFLKYVSSKENIERLQQNQAKSARVIKEASPRLDMRNSELIDPNVSGMIKIAPTARVWYLASETNDGETGLNTQLSNLFFNIFADTRNIEIGKIGDFGLQVRTLLAQYGLATPPPPVED